MNVDSLFGVSDLIFELLHPLIRSRHQIFRLGV